MRVVQMGTQQRSAPHYTEAVDYVKVGGKLGKIRSWLRWHVRFFTCGL